MIQFSGLQQGFDQAQLGLAAGTLFVREVGADQHIIPVHALGFEDVHHQILGRLEVFQRQTGGAQSILVGDHDELIACGLQFAQHGDHHGFKA